MGDSRDDFESMTEVWEMFRGVLCELLTGVTPFAAEKLRASAPDEILRIIREKEPPKPSTRLHLLTTAEIRTVAACRRWQTG